MYLDSHRVMTNMDGMVSPQCTTYTKQRTTKQRIIMVHVIVKTAETNNLLITKFAIQVLAVSEQRNDMSSFVEDRIKETC